MPKVEHDRRYEIGDRTLPNKLGYFKFKEQLIRIFD